jgi:hypothetical protein
MFLTEKRESDGKKTSDCKNPLLDDIISAAGALRIMNTANPMHIRPEIISNKVEACICFIKNRTFTSESPLSCNYYMHTVFEIYFDLFLRIYGKFFGEN